MIVRNFKTHISFLSTKEIVVTWKDIKFLNSFDKVDKLNIMKENLLYRKIDIELKEIEIIIRLGNNINIKKSYNDEL